MVIRGVSLRLAGVADKESPRFSRVAVVVVISLAHAVLFFLAARESETNHLRFVAPVPISVRWVDAPVETEQPAPSPKSAQPPSPAVKPVEPPPAVTPARKPRPKIIHLPASPPGPVEGSSSLQASAEIVPQASPPTNVPMPDSARGIRRDETPSPVTPPRADAAYLSNPPPDYPAEARRLGQEGRVLLRVLVAADGHAQDVSIDQGCGFPLLDDAAAAAVRRWRFTPGRRGDTAVAAWVLIPIFFKLRTR